MRNLLPHQAWALLQQQPGVLFADGLPWEQM